MQTLARNMNANDSPDDDCGNKFDDGDDHGDDDDDDNDDDDDDDPI